MSVVATTVERGTVITGTVIIGTMIARIVVTGTRVTAMITEVGLTAVMAAAMPIDVDTALSAADVSTADVSTADMTTADMTTADMTTTVSTLKAAAVTTAANMPATVTATAAMSATMTTAAAMPATTVTAAAAFPATAVPAARLRESKRTGRQQEGHRDNRTDNNMATHNHTLSPSSSVNAAGYTKLVTNSPQNRYRTNFNYSLGEKPGQVLGHLKLAGKTIQHRVSTAELLSVQSSNGVLGKSWVDSGADRDGADSADRLFDPHQIHAADRALIGLVATDLWMHRA